MNENQVSNMLGHGGIFIENKDEILSAIDEKLGVSKPPDLEILFVEHTMRKVNLGKFHQENIGRLGHSAVKYRIPSTGEYYVMNISAPADHPTLINFIDPTDYFFGINFDKGNGAVQGGIYNRSYIGLRIENCRPGTIESLHLYYKALEAKEKDLKTAQFQLIGSRFTNFLRKVLPWNESIHEVGNCTHWGANGLVWCSILPRKHMFPKDLFISLFEKYSAEQPDNIHVVYYKEIEHARKFYPEWMSTQSLVAPFRFLRNWYYFDFLPFCDIVVEVPKNEKKAIITKKKGKRPGFNFNHLNYFWVSLLVLTVLWNSEFSLPLSNIFIRMLILLVIYFFYFWINL